MKSFCVKNNNENILNYLLTEIKKFNITDIYISQKKFKHYKNIIVHYRGNETKDFIMMLSQILTNSIIKFYETTIVKRLINTDYFYFTTLERKYIFKNCIEILNDINTKDYEIRREKIFLSLFEYISEHDFFILDGFVNFRLFEYTSMIEEVVDISVNKFIIDKEYREFIQLLQSFINSQKSKTGTVHIIYSNCEPIILDDKEHIIPYDKKFVQPKYLSDISFSSKDYCLNELLNLLPKKIILHMLVEEDEFTNTLQLIFNGRLIVCKECNICKTFGMISGYNSRLVLIF